MYNRYIPQADGTYSRRSIQDTPPRPVNPPLPREGKAGPRSPNESHGRNESGPTDQKTSGPPPMPVQRRQEPDHRQQASRQSAPDPCPPATEASVGKFLRNLLPKNFDTGDLLIVLLLLLMAGDNQEEQNTALLTLALYLFL